MTTRRMDLSEMKKASRRQKDGMLTWLLVLFQTTAMLLLTFRTYPVDYQALIMAGPGTPRAQRQQIRVMPCPVGVPGTGRQPERG